MHIFSIMCGGRRSYRLTYHDGRGLVSSWLPTKQAQRMLRALSGI